MIETLGRRTERGLAALLLATLVLVVSISAQQPAVAAGGRPDPSTWRLGPSGIGPLKLGMSVKQARAQVPGLRVSHHQFCDTWTVPGIDGFSMFSTHDRGGLSSASISSYTDELEPGHGAGGVEIGDSVHKLKQTFGKRLRFIESSRSLRKAFYRLYSHGGRHTAVEFTVNTRSGRVEYEQAGFIGEFYYTDGVELCA